MVFHKNRWSIRQDRFVAPAAEVINRQMPKLLKLALVSSFLSGGVVVWVWDCIAGEF